MNRCRSCKKPVLWTRTAKGHNHPLDLEPAPLGDWIIVGDVMQRWSGEDASVPRYTSHFATCEYADRHRRPK